MVVLEYAIFMLKKKQGKIQYRENGGNLVLSKEWQPIGHIEAISTVNC